jgi:hypothetical protein
LYQGKAELSDATLLSRLDPTECISWNCTPSASVPCIDDSGREVVVPAGGLPPDFDFTVLGQPITGLKRGPIRMAPRACELQFTEAGRVQNGTVQKAALASEVARTFGPDAVLVFEHVALNGNFKAVPAHSLIHVLHGPLKTVADFGGEREGRWIFRDDETVLPGSVAAGSAVKFVRLESTDAPSRGFAVTIPFAPGVRSFFFDYETTVADACETIADLANLPFSPDALFSNGCPLTDDEFIFDVAAGRLEVRLQRSDPNQLRIREKLGVEESLISKDWRSVADIKAAIGRDIDLVAAGKVWLIAKASRMPL